MVTVTSRCKKNLYQVQHSTVKYRFSFRTLSDRNMKMDCHAIYFVQILNLVSRGYISLDRTHSFHEILGDSPENLRKLLWDIIRHDRWGIIRREHSHSLWYFTSTVLSFEDKKPLMLSSLNSRRFNDLITF